jgi:hypothetical protein
MNAVKPISDSHSNSPHSFVVAGISLMAIRKELKAALPKKKQEPFALALGEHG